MGRGEPQRWSEDRALELDDVPGRDSVALSQKRQKLCSREESNLHGFPHTVLSRTRLPFRHVSERLLRCARRQFAQAHSGGQRSESWTTVNFWALETAHQTP